MTGQINREMVKIMETNKKSSLQVIKNNNKKMILKLIHKNKCITRAELKRITGLAPTTVSTLVDEFIAEGIVKETGVFDTGGIGRKAVAIEINSTGKYFAGVEIESDYTFVDIYDLCFNVAFSAQSETGDYEKTKNFIVDSLNKGQEKLNSELHSVSIGVSGIVDPKTSKILLSTVVDIEDENFVCDIQSAFPEAYVYLLNSSGLIAFAEKEQRGVMDLVTVDIGKGVGSGIIIDGRIYTGAGGTAGEFGHISIDINGEKCKCGNRGCTEIYTNTHTIRRKAAAILGVEKVSLREVKEQADNGNVEICNLLNEVTEVLSVALVGLINMMAPQSVVISGKIKELGSAFLVPLIKAVSDKCSLKSTQIEYSSVDGNAVTLGGVKLAFAKMLK